jgi:hypothetical protein
MFNLFKKKKEKRSLLEIVEDIECNLLENSGVYYISYSDHIIYEWEFHIFDFEIGTQLKVREFYKIDNIYYNKSYKYTV